MTKDEVVKRNVARWRARHPKGQNTPQKVLFQVRVKNTLPKFRPLAEYLKEM